MLALYRSGRQADALATYRAFRATLDEELGIEPSAELRALELSILRQDEPAPTPARAATRTAAGPRRSATSSSGDLSIAYQVVGDGPLDIVLVHGWVCSFQPGWERPQIARFYRAARRHGPAHPVRQARDRAVGPRRGDRAARGAHGRHARGDRRRRLRARGGARRERGRADVGAVRRDLPGADGGARGHGLVRPAPARRPTTRSTSRSCRSRPRSGACPPRGASSSERAPTVADDEEAIRWYASYLVRGASPGAAAQMHAHEPGDRHPARAADDPGARRWSSTARRSTCARRRATWAASCPARA